MEKARQRSFYLAARHTTLRGLKPQVGVPGAYRRAQWGGGGRGGVGQASCGKKEKKKGINQRTRGSTEGPGPLGERQQGRII